MKKNRISHHPFGAILPGGNGHLPGNLKVSEICYVGSHNSGCSKVIFVQNERIMGGFMLNKGSLLPNNSNEMGQDTLKYHFTGLTPKKDVVDVSIGLQKVRIYLTSLLHMRVNNFVNNR